MKYQDLDSGELPIKINFSSVKSLLSDKSSLQPYTNNNRFPFRPAINMALIILITFQVYLVVSSHMYLRGSLVRSFLQIYADDDNYPNLFQGQSFYLTIKNITQVKQNLKYTFEQMRIINKNSFLKINLNYSKIFLSIEYLHNLQEKNQQNQFIIDPNRGIKQPFDMENVTDIQKFLIQINWFKIIVQNITVQNQGFYQKYYHEVKYDFQDGLQIMVDFKFQIDNAMLDSVKIDKPQANYLKVIKLFYLIILTLSFMSLYFNYNYVRRTMIVIFKQLGDKKSFITSQKKFIQLNPQDKAQINQAVLKWIKINKLTLQQLTFKHYFYILQFDVICSIISNLFSIVGSIYLFIGLEKQIIIGLSCFMAWLTVFKFLKRKKQLVLMYELIKLSFIKIIFFFIQFFPVFLAYTLLGICLFPKTGFFSSLSKSVTTLVSLMMGDSIQMITAEAIQKYNSIIVILYIFTFVLMFMHAIHNTLTSLIKQAFIIKKIELINEQKNKKKQNHYVYLSELRCVSDQEKQKLPIRLTTSLKKQLFRINHLKKSNSAQLKIKKWLKQFQKVFYQQKWQMQQNEQLFDSLHFKNIYVTELKRRLTTISQLLRCFQQIDYHGYDKNYIPGESILTDQ